MDSLAVVFVGLGALWLTQFALTWRQAQAFLRTTRALRRLGRVATGTGRHRPLRRAFVSLAVDDTGRIVAARALSGHTVFARPRPVPALTGLAVADLAHGATPPGLTPPVQAAAVQAAGFLTRTAAPAIA